MSLPEQAKSVIPRINLPYSVTLSFHRVLLADLISCKHVGRVIKVRRGEGPDILKQRRLNYGFYAFQEIYTQTYIDDQIMKPALHALEYVNNKWTESPPTSFDTPCLPP
jgi:hypothetical protein